MHIPLLPRENPTQSLSNNSSHENQQSGSGLLHQQHSPSVCFIRRSLTVVGNSFFCGVVCSQAYHSWQTADQLSVETLAISFASKTFADKTLAQGLLSFVSAISSFMRKDMDPVVNSDDFAQYEDDSGSAANEAKDLARNIQAVFESFRKAGLKQTAEKCHFGARPVELFGKTISSEGFSALARKTHNFHNRLRFSKSKKALQRYLGVAIFLQKSHL